MGNPLMDRLRKRTGKGASKSAKDAEAQEAKTPASPAEPAEETAAPTPSAKSAAKGKGKKLTALERMKAGKNKGKSAKTATGEESSTSASDKSGTAASAKEPVGVNPPKNKRKAKGSSTGSASKKAATTKPSADVSPAGSGNTLYIGCYPVQGVATPVALHVLLEDVKATVCKANDVTHWDFLEYGKGSAALAQALDAKLIEEGVPPVLYAEPFSSESRAVEQILLKHYDIVVRGTR